MCIFDFGVNCFFKKNTHETKAGRLVYSHEFLFCAVVYGHNDTVVWM